MSPYHMIVILMSARSCLGSHFRGGIITWAHTEYESQIEVSYRVSWRRSYGSSHLCDDSHISSGQMLSGEGSLLCTGGCTVTSISMGYYCTDFSLSEDWTTGTRKLIYNLTTNATEILFTYTSCCWIGLQVGGSGGWALKARASVTKRADTRKINSSPKTSVSPIVRVTRGCNATIHILASDPDGDTVRCRWSNASDECGDICLSFPGAVLNKETCSVSYQATGSDGYYGVAVQVEDFPAKGGTVPYSSVPVQFLVYVYSTSQGCYSLPEFISPTRGDQEVVYITVNNVYADKIIAISNVSNTSIEEITTVSPRGLIKSALAMYPNVPGAWYVNITWTPTTSDVNIVHILCFTATDKLRLTSQQRCISLIVTLDVATNGSKRIQFESGQSNGDSLIKVNDGKCELVSKDYEFPMFRSNHSKIFVCITGIVTFDESFDSPGTVDGSAMKGRAILAPYFTDIDTDSLKRGGNVSYHIYNSIKGDISNFSNVRTVQEIIKGIHGDVGQFNIQFALFVTWNQVLPTSAKMRSREKMSFQFALVTDGVYTFAFYVYPTSGIKLKSQQVYIGFTTKDGPKYKDYRSFTSSVGSIDESAISFGYAGLLHYRLSFPSLGPKSSRQNCIEWYLNERKNKDEYDDGLEKMPLCPCDTSHLVRDQFYSDNDYFYQGNAFCTYIRPNWQFRPADSGKTCCYDKTDRYFMGYGADSGGFIRYHPYMQALKHKSYDREMRTACCEENDLCSLYHSVRPIGQCYTIFPAWHAPARGDPHFKTLDGMNYTFNGWGEFTLVKINSSTEKFELQARTSRVLRKDGNMSDATAFVAFAARDSNDANVHVELNATKNGFIVYARMAPGLMLSDYTSECMDMDKEFNFASGYLSLSRSNQTKNVKAVFSSGVAFTVGISVNMLNIDVLIPKKFKNMTAGLLGNFDGDPANDFQFKNGSILWHIIREKDIFEFGQKWAVDPNQSAFWYPRGKGYYDYSHLNYTPTFLEDLDAAKVSSAKEVCGEEEYECIFDLVLTEDEDVANETRRLGDVSTRLNKVLANEAPRISGPTIVNVTINETVTYQVNASDDGKFTYQLLDGQMYANITDQTNATALVTLILQDDRPINVKATVMDELGVQATPHQLVIVMCSTCNQRGTCDFEEFRDDERTTDTFKYATCRCYPYWDGPECELDRDGCAPQPCSPLRNCTDIPADVHQISGVGYNCSNCPAGFASTNDGRCEDIDECSSSNDSCSQICNNTYGTFLCSCFKGFRKFTGSETCQDINECSEATNDCDQICLNNIGGYNCSCYDGFVFNSVKNSCEVGTLPSGCNSLNCSGTTGCTTNEHGNATCFCTKGFQLSSDGNTCNDVNECQLSVCQHRCTNTEGSFNCSCFNGYIIESDRSSCQPCEFPKYGENCNNTCECGQGAIRCDHIKGCICSETWTGANCDEDLDECLVPNICNESFNRCLNTNGSYICSCMDGYTLNASGSCTDRDECNEPELNTCQQVCKNEAGGFSCSCIHGYIQRKNDTKYCEDIDECDVGQSGCEQLCKNSEGRYTCDCYFGYILNNDRKTCTKVEDPCVTFGNINCSQICVLEDGHIFCSCVTGYRLSSDNQTCEDINECEDHKLNRCSHNCTNEIAGYACSCPGDLKLANDGRTCKACDAFHYGPNCSKPCNCGAGAKVCDPITGCVCKDGWNGTTCDQDMDECLKNPCTGNNNRCINTIGSYVCNCLIGYINDSGVCQDIVECNDPRLNECNHICHNNIGSYSCSCYEGFVLNGAVCTVACKANQYGQDCAFNCTCHMENTQTCVSADGTCLCRKGWAGTQCSIDVDECSSSSRPCGAANMICVNNPGSFVCECEHGYVMNNDTQCIACQPNKYGKDCAMNCTCYMENTQSCDTRNGTCLCREGWTGTECSQDVNECSNSSSPCGAANTFCVNIPGSFVCKCEQGYVKNATQCIDVDECAGLHNCSHQCANTEGSYRCTCNEGFQLSQADNSSCSPCQPNKYGKDCAMNCTCYMENTQSCDTRNGTCLCREGWTGTECSQDVNECSNSSSPCGAANTFCVNIPGSFVCKCEQGYVKNATQCIDVDECAGLHNCSHQCANTEGSYRCTCNEGFQLSQADNSSCSPCQPNKYGKDCAMNCTCYMENTQSCDTRNGTCLCREGWTGTECSQDVNECSNSSSPCGAANTFCVNIPGSFVCKCEQGYVKNATQCIDVDECAGLHNCSHQCANTEGSYRCTCNEGFQLSQADNSSCSPCQPNKYGKDCAINCTCYMENTQSCDSRNGTCLCREGWTGTECSQDVNECSNSSSLCGAANTFCVNIPGSFICKCEQGYVKNATQCIDVDECAGLHNCSHQCANTEGSYRCTCNEGFQLSQADNRSCLVCKNNTFGMNCNFYCSCYISNSINKNQTCDSNNGTCLCKEGWMGVECSQDINECELNPGVCDQINNSGCYNVYGSFKCLCHIGYIYDLNGRCVEDVPKTTTPIAIDDTHALFKGSITFDFSLQASIDIKVPENYAKIESDVQDALSEFYRTKMDQLFVRIVIISIRRGSLILEYSIITWKSEDALLKLANANAKLAAGEMISLAGRNSSALRLSVEGNDLPNATSAYQVLCKSYQSLKGDCTMGYECVVINNRPTCMPRKKEDNFVLIVAVGTGASLSVLLILVIVTVVVFKWKEKQRKSTKESIYRSDNISNQRNQHFATKGHTFTWMKTGYGLYPSDMFDHRSCDNKQNNYPRSDEGNKEDNPCGSSYGHEVRLSACTKGFKINRPKVYGFRNVVYDSAIYN